MGKFVIKKVKVRGSKGEREVTALFDTGSGYSFVRPRIADEVDFPTPFRLWIATIDKEGFEDKQKISAEVEIEGHKRGMFMVVKDLGNLPFEMILGTDAMDLFKIKVCPEEDRIEIAENSQGMVVSPIFTYKTRYEEKHKILPFR